MRNLADKLCPEIADSETCGGDGTITATIDTSKTNTATAQFYLYGINSQNRFDFVETDYCYADSRLHCLWAGGRHLAL